MIETISPPDSSEVAAYYLTYINQVPPGDIRRVLEAQGRSTLAWLRTVGEEPSLYRYEPEKWSIREVVSHINDAERVFAFRAFWFARGFTAPMPSYDQDAGVPLAVADSRSWDSHLDEFAAVRAATVTLFQNLPEAAWQRRGIASDTVVSVRALAFICAGHVEHHLNILREKYGLNGSASLSASQP